MQIFIEIGDRNSFVVYLGTSCVQQCAIKHYKKNSYSQYISSFSFGVKAPPPQRARAFLLSMIHDHTQRRTTVIRIPLDERSARRRDLYLTTHNTHNRQTSMLPGGIRTHTLNIRAAADLRLRPRGHWDRQLCS